MNEGNFHSVKCTVIGSALNPAKGTLKDSSCWNTGFRVAQTHGLD
jgi:hypothetical protein